MTIVLVHGVPEASAIWEPLVAELGDLGNHDIVTLSPPGFGAPVPAGFEATSDGYTGWLIGELEQFDAPVHLVGHDWGGGHALRAATRRPDLVRKLVTDIAGTADAQYEWHDMAKVWQTDGDGEAFVEASAAMSIDDRVAMLVGAGMTDSGARACAEANGPEMGACILALYRSAKQPRMTLWGDQFTELDDRPEVLVVVAHDDHYTGGPEMARRVAEKWDAQVAELPGVGHWWMMQDPATGAAALDAFLT